METAIYKKVGRKYLQIGVYDDEVFYLPKGAHLTIIDDGWRSTRYSIEQKDAEYLASIYKFRNMLTSLIVEESKPRPSYKHTPEQQEAWEKYLTTLGKDVLHYYHYPSIQECVDKALDKMKEFV